MVPMSMTTGRWIGVVAVAVAIVGAAALTLVFATQLRAQIGGPHPFDPIAAVMQNPRCMNCHPRGDTPGNGETGRPHLMKITRGPDGHGAPGARCSACHRSENSEFTIVPGAPNWHLAPRSMGWKGLSKAELCAALKDRNLNGGRDLTALVKHMGTDPDPLVLWGWNPGQGRAPVPIPHAEFVRLLKVWADAGGPCPAS
jgi:hypothetical protein